MLTFETLRTVGNFPKCTPTHDLRVAVNIPYVCDFITQLCRQQHRYKLLKERLQFDDFFVRVALSKAHVV
jgi:hypothetical protein